MSYPIMPALPMSMAKGLKKTPNFDGNAVIKTAAGRGNSGLVVKPYCTWDFEFDLDKIQGNESLATSVLAQFFGIYIACQGTGGLFLFTDPQDNTASNGNVLAGYHANGMLSFGPTGTNNAGDGVTTQFQLARQIGVPSAWDVIQNINGAISVAMNGGTPLSGSAYSVSPTGVVTFATAPTIGALPTWQGSFYYLCRFDANTVDAIRSFTTNNGTDQWDISSIKFASEFA
jgi:hypothetical protein